MKNGTHIRVGPKWIEMERLLKQKCPYLSSREISDRVAQHMMDEKIVDRWLKVEPRRRPKGIFGRFF